MRKIIILIAGVAACAPVCVFATGFGSLVSSFKSPGAWPMGMSYRPGYLYISTSASNVVWRTTTTGSIISYHPLKLSNNQGISVGTIGGNTYYWVVDRDTSHIYRYVDNSSTVHGSFAAPGPNPWGVTFVDASHMYYTERGGKLYSMHPMTGSVYASYPLSFNPGDLAYDESGYLWVGCPVTDIKAIYQCTLTGSPVASFSVMKYGRPGGCAFDGEYVWVSIYDPGVGFYAVMQYSVREEPAVAPASLGRIKTLYR